MRLEGLISSEQVLEGAMCGSWDIWCLRCPLPCFWVVSTGARLTSCAG